MRLTIAFGCVTLLASIVSTVDAQSSIDHLSRQARAMALVANGLPVRWIGREMRCAIPFDAKTLPDCAAMKRDSISETVYQQTRAALTAYTAGAKAFVACIGVSREVRVGDSSVVVVRMVDGEISEDVSDSERAVIWFRKQGTVDKMWVGRDPLGEHSSQTRPITREANCK